MPAGTQTTLEEYLGTEYKPACELISGEAVAKPLGTLEHMHMERRLLRLLEKYESPESGSAMHELSIRRNRDVRIPDVVFLRARSRFENGILIDPPLLCVEILSPSQRLSELFAKCEAYHDWEVPYCWVIDPIQKAAWEYHRESPVRLIPGDESLNAGEITVRVPELFT